MSQKKMSKVNANITYTIWVINPGRHIDVLLSMTFAFGRRGYLKTSSAVVSWNHMSKALMLSRKKAHTVKFISDYMAGKYKYGMIA